MTGVTLRAMDKSVFSIGTVTTVSGTRYLAPGTRHLVPGSTTKGAAELFHNKLGSLPDPSRAAVKSKNLKQASGQASGSLPEASGVQVLQMFTDYTKE